MAVHEPAHLTKLELRHELLGRRAERTPEERARAVKALCARVSAIPQIAAAARVACYVSTPAEPGTQPLVAMLVARGVEVLLPTLQPDFDLGWAAYREGELRAARFGISEPTGASLGVDGIHDASVVICPALAADQRGHRLGRGGGSYDRVLGRLADAVLRVALVYDDEVLDAVPTAEHDQRVHLLVTPERTLTGWSPQV